MKLNKSVIIPLLFFAFAALGLEALVLPYVSFGAGRWTDSTGWNVSNRKSKVLGDVDITGSFKINGTVISGGGGAIVNYDTILSAQKDTARFASLKRANTYLNTNVYTEGLEAYTLLLSYDSLHSLGKAIFDLNATQFNAGIQFTDATKVITDSGNNILYRVTTGGAHIMETQNGTDLLKVDSTNGLTYINSAIRWGGNPSQIKTKLVKFASASGSLPAYITFSHGLGSVGSKIINVSGYIQCDTTGWNLSGLSTGNDLKFPPRSPLSAAGTWDFYFDSLNISIYLASTATAIRNNTDTAFFWLTYLE